MTDYTNRAAEVESFMDLMEDDDFKKDLIQFYSGGRYKMSKEDMKKEGFEGLSKRFAEHMRHQAWNEVTAVKDLNYVNNKDMDQRGKDAFGRLIKAWDNSQSAGTGFFEGVGDFSEAILTAPSTYVGLGSFGLGKVGAKAANYATQTALRGALKQGLMKNIAKSAATKSVGAQALRSGALGFTSGAVIGGGQAIAEGEIREEVVEGFEYGGKDALRDVLISGAIEGTVGAGLGVISGAIGAKRQNTVKDFLQERGRVVAEKRQEAAEKALFTLNEAPESVKKEASKILSDLDDIFAAREGVKGATGIKDPLDPERVKRGQAILNAMTDTKANPVFSSGLSVDTMRSVAAAASELMQNQKLGIEGSERITESVARALSGEGAEENFKMIEGIRKKYGLSKDEFSLIYLAEASRAGRVLGFQSAIKRGAKVALGKIDEKETSDLDVIFSKGASSISSGEAEEIVGQAVRRSTKDQKIYGFFQDLDAMRIAFMTSQPATTMRNLRNSGILLATDVVDEVNRGLYKGLFQGDVRSVKDIIPNTTSMLRGFTINNAEAKMLKAIIMDEMPETSRRLYSNAARVEMALEGSSVMAKAGRVVNVFNTAVDSVLKEGMFYGSLDRQFRDKGLSLKDWLKENKSMEELPEGISFEKSINEAQRLTMQYDFKGDDSALGTTAKTFISINRKVPFLVSQGLGMPFPRYTANHLQMVAEYTPVLGELMHKGKLIKSSEDPAQRMARQMTGMSLLLGGYALAYERDGEVDYGSIRNALGEEADMKQYAGSILAHLYVGDLLWRLNKGLPVNFDRNEVSAVFGGIPEFSLDLGFPESVYNSLKEGAPTEEFEKELGNFLATFTMPLALARDTYNQFNPAASGNPYVRDLALGEDVSRKGAGALSQGIFGPQATRFLPDVGFVQYTQSFDGEQDPKIYDYDNPVARSTVSPLYKQISGGTSEPPLTALQKYQSRYGIKNWQMFNKGSLGALANANTELVVQQRLAKTLPQKFEAWKSEAPVSNKFGRLTFDELTPKSTGIPMKELNKEKAEILKQFIRQEIAAEASEVQDMFDTFVARDPVKARGYIRNNFAIQVKDKGKDVFNQAARELGFDGYKEMIGSAESVKEEINLRLRLLNQVPLEKSTDIYSTR